MEQVYFEQEHFEGLNFSEKVFEDYSFSACHFEKCTFEACQLAHCSFAECTFSECTIINLKAAHKSQIRFGEFYQCELIGVNWGQLIPHDKYPQPLSKIEDCHLKYNIFPGMKLKKFDFRGNIITDSMFEECQLEESTFKGCALERTEFTGCDLRKADFRNATDYQVGLLTNKLSGARFSFPEVVTLLNSLNIKVE